MDDTQIKIDNQQFQQAAQPQPAQTQSAVAAQPVGSMQKEQATASASEFIKPSEEEPVLSPEEEQTGVEKVSEFPRVGEEQYKVGIRPAKESTPVATQPSDEIKLPPLPEQEVLQEIKTTSADDSKHWLMVLFEKIYQQLRLMRKKIIGN